MILTSEKMAKIIASFAQTIAARATYELNGVDSTTSYTVSTKGHTVKIIILLDNNVFGQIGNVKVYDADNLLACSSDKVFVKPAGKKQYIAFSFTFSERMM